MDEIDARFWAALGELQSRGMAEEACAIISAVGELASINSRAEDIPPEASEPAGDQLAASHAA